MELEALLQAQKAVFMMRATEIWKWSQMASGVTYDPHLYGLACYWGKRGYRSLWIPNGRRVYIRSLVRNGYENLMIYHVLEFFFGSAWFDMAWYLLAPFFFAMLQYK